jgi:MFS family permease
MTSGVVTEAAEGGSRAARTLAVISAVHLVSHYYWLAFAPMMPALRDLLNVSYTELGLAITVMNAVSAVTQAPTGFIVDRYGPRLLLFIGVLIGSAGFILIGLVPTYPMLIAGAVLIGLGNAVYHPADYSILSAEMPPARMGRAYSIHSFTGYIGFAIAPPLVLALLWLDGVRLALIVTGLIGMVLTLPLLPDIPGEQRGLRVRRASPKPQTSARSLVTPGVIALTLMFTTLNMSTGMIQTYMMVALEQLFDMPLNAGNTALTVFLGMLVVGIIIGGFIADRLKHQSTMAAAGLTGAALLFCVIGAVNLGVIGTIAVAGLAGLLAGIIVPSRDLLVRQASPPDAVGRVFGIVTTGFNFGGMVSPIVGGMLVDHHAPVWIFYTSAAFMLLTVVIAVWVDRSEGLKLKG